MKNKLQYIMAGAGITLLVILGALTLLLPRAQADVATENTDGEIVTAVESTQSDSSDVLPLVNQNEPEQTANTKTETAPDSLAATESPTESSEEALFSAMGTKDNPQTNMEIIVYTVSELARKQEEALLGKPGWLHVHSSFYIPDEFRGDGTYSLATDEILPMEKLVPNSPQTENWYHVNEEGVYHEGVGLITNPDGLVYQQSILWNGQWTNLTLKTNDFAPDQYIMPVSAPEKILLPITQAYQQLDMKLTWSNVEMQATMDGDQYIVIVEQRYDAPIEDAIFMPEPIIGSRETFIFDVNTGQLSIETQALLESQTWLFTEKWEYEPVEFVAELPNELAQLFNSALNDLQEDK